MKKILSQISLSLLLTTLLLVSPNRVWGDEKTVAEGTTANSYIPFYGYYADYYERIQIVYPASMLSDLDGATISAMKFYLATSANAAWTATCSVSLSYSSDATIASASAWNTGTGTTTVYTGTINGTGSTMTITFSNTFTYSGGNLLFELTTPTKGTNYPKASFYGITSTNGAMYGYNSSSLASVNKNRTNFIPQTTFTYTSSSPVTCPKPTALTKGTITDNSASFTWTAGGSETTWQYLCLPAATTLTDSHWTSATTVTTTSATKTGLSANTSYKFYVRAVCGGSDGNSNVVSESFKTECGSLTNLPTYGFEDVANGNIPECWERIEYSGSPDVYEYSTYAHDGSKSLRFYGGGSSSSQIIILPKFTNPNPLAELNYSVL